MNIIGTQYTLKTKAFEIYVAGCNGSPHCKGCHNPETWDFNQGNKYEDCLNEMIDTINKYNTLVNNVMIFGGEPLDQDINCLYQLLYNIKQRTNKQIWIFTRYDINEVPKCIKDMCTYIKCGRYDENKITNDNIQYGIKLATSNQYIYKNGIDF